MEQKVDFTREIVIGQYADYLDTGIWSRIDGRIVAPEDLTMRQLKDFLLVSGGAVYLGKEGRFVWGEIDWQQTPKESNG